MKSEKTTLQQLADDLLTTTVAIKEILGLPKTISNRIPLCRDDEQAVRMKMLSLALGKGDPESIRNFLLIMNGKEFLMELDDYNKVQLLALAQKTNIAISPRDDEAVIRAEVARVLADRYLREHAISPNTDRPSKTIDRVKNVPQVYLLAVGTAALGALSTLFAVFIIVLGIIGGLVRRQLPLYDGWVWMLLFIGVLLLGIAGAAYWYAKRNKITWNWR